MTQALDRTTLTRGNNEHRLIGLDLLRCFAIGGVVLSHSLGFIYPYVPAVNLGFLGQLHLYHLGHLGFYGVELFFVLSGYLIGGLLVRQGEELSKVTELKRFYLRRWFRTLPNYYLFLGINFILTGTLMGGPFLWERLPKYSFFLQNLVSAKLDFFLESWSLGIEEWFYLVFAFTLFIVLRRNPKRVNAFLLVGITLYSASTLCRILYANNADNLWHTAQREVVIIRFDALMTGVLAAWASHNYPGVFYRNKHSAAFLGLMILVICYTTLYIPGDFNNHFFAKTFRFNFVSLGFACLLPWATQIQNMLNGTLAWLIESLSRWSYSMYFVNLPFMYYVNTGLFPKNQSSAIQGWCAFVLGIVGTVTLSALIFKYFEYPITNLRDRFSGSVPPPKKANAVS